MRDQIFAAYGYYLPFIVDGFSTLYSPSGIPGEHIIQVISGSAAIEKGSGVRPIGGNVSPNYLSGIINGSRRAKCIPEEHTQIDNFAIFQRIAWAVSL
jgi:hypothetical protein